MNQVMMTTAAETQIISAGGGNSNGPYFPIKYFTLVYDPSFDSAIHTVNLGKVTDVLSFSATSVSGDTDAVQHLGNYVFNIPNAYTISSHQYLISGAGIGTSQGYQDVNTISGNACSSLTEVNLLYGNVCTPCFSSDSVAPSFVDYGKWYLPNASTYATTASVSASAGTTLLNDRTKYFQVSSYSPIASTISNSNLRGLFKCRIGNDIGNFKFNKIALYTTTFDSFGNEIVGTKPTLVAMAGLRDTIYKYVDGGSVINVEMDIECEFKVTNTFGSNVYMTNDYWTRINGSGVIGTGAISGVGLYYNGDIAIGTSGDSGWLPHAKLELTDYDKPQIRLNGLYGSRYTNIRTGSNGACEIGTYSTKFTDTLFYKNGDGVEYDVNRIFLNGTDLMSSSEGFTTFVGQKIDLLCDQYGQNSIGESISISSANNSYDVYGQKIDVIDNVSLNGALNTYGVNINVSADGKVKNNAGQALYGLYVSLGTNVTGVTGTVDNQVYAAYFDKGDVRVNGTLLASKDMYFYSGDLTATNNKIYIDRNSIVFTGVSSSISTLEFNQYAGVYGSLNIFDNKDPGGGTPLGYTRINFNDTNTYIEKNSTTNYLTICSEGDMELDSLGFQINSVNDMTIRSVGDTRRFILSSGTTRVMLSSYDEGSSDGIELSFVKPTTNGFVSHNTNFIFTDSTASKYNGLIYNSNDAYNGFVLLSTEQESKVSHPLTTPYTLYTYNLHNEESAVISGTTTYSGGDVTNRAINQGGTSHSVFCNDLRYSIMAGSAGFLVNYDGFYEVEFFLYCGVTDDASNAFKFFVVNNIGSTITDKIQVRFPLNASVGFSSKMYMRLTATNSIGLCYNLATYSPITFAGTYTLKIKRIGD